MATASRMSVLIALMKQVDVKISTVVGSTRNVNELRIQTSCSQFIDQIYNHNEHVGNVESESQDEVIEQAITSAQTIIAAQVQCLQEDKERLENAHTATFQNLETVTKLAETFNNEIARIKILIPETEKTISELQSQLEEINQKIESLQLKLTTVVHQIEGVCVKKYF